MLCSTNPIYVQIHKYKNTNIQIHKYKYTNTSESAGITCVLCSTNPIYVPRRRADATLMEISIADAHFDGKAQCTL